MAKLAFVKGIVGIAAFVAVLGTAGLAHATVFDCRPNHVGESFGVRAVVGCSNSIVVNGQTIRWIAVPTSDVQRSNRVLTVATSALLSGKVFRVDIPASSANNPSGCSATDCRAPDWFGIVN